MNLKDSTETLEHLTKLISDPEYNIPNDANFFDFIEIATETQNPFLLYSFINVFGNSIESLNAQELLEIYDATKEFFTVIRLMF